VRTTSTGHGKVPMAVAGACAPCPRRGAADAAGISSRLAFVKELQDLVRPTYGLNTRRHRNDPGNNLDRYCVHTDLAHTTGPFGSHAARSSRLEKRYAAYRRRKLDSAHDNNSDRCSDRTRLERTLGDNMTGPSVGVSRPRVPAPRSISPIKTSLSSILVALEIAIFRHQYRKSELNMI
jgi:hypothetical protein